MERKKRIVSLPDYGPNNGSPDVILFMGESYEKAGAGKDVLTDSNNKAAAYSPTRVTNALAVSHCGYREAHEAPDIIQYEDESYVRPTSMRWKSSLATSWRLGTFQSPWRPARAAP